MTRILVFSPYALWGIHTIYEETIATACKARGASVEYLLCDGLLPECDQHWDSKEDSSRPPDLCQRCRLQSKANLDRLGFPYQWLGEFVSDEQKLAILAWAEAVPPAELRRAFWQDSPIGEWVLSSVISYFRQYPPDIANSHVVDVYRGFLMSGAIVATGLCKYIADNAINSAILFNGRQSITRVAFEVFRQRGIPVLTHERAEYLKGHVNVRSNAGCMNPEPFKAFWSKLAQIPLNRESLDATLKWLIQRRYGANLAWIPFNKSFAVDGNLRTRLNISKSKHLWALFTSSTDEVAGDPVMQGPYESQAAWVREVIQWVSLRDDVELIIKVHPNLAGNAYIGRATSEMQIFQQMAAALPVNVRIVMPDELVNAYSVADEAEVGLTFGSTIGLEMAMLGKPVLVASRAIYESSSSILAVQDRELLPEMLEKCLHASTDRKIQREAFRLAYYYIFKFELPFPAITVQDIYRAELNYINAGDLSAGKDDSLDRICNFLISGLPLHNEPSSYDRLRTTADEDAFFEELANAPEYLVNTHYERWLKMKSLGRAVTGLLKRLPFGIGNTVLQVGRRSWHTVLNSFERGDNVPPQPRKSGEPK